MTRAMLDTVSPDRLPVDALLVGAYVDGMYANEAQVRARCPHATVVTITTRAPGKPGAHVADIEAGDLTPEQGAQWAANEVKAGRLPTLYCNLSTWPEVKQHVAAHGISVSYWIAHYDDKPEMIPGAVAHQYVERTDQNLDYSVAADYWPGVDPAPITAEAVVAPQPIPEEPDMIVVYATGRALCLLAAGKLHPLSSNSEKDALVAAGVPIKKVTPAQFDLIDGVSKRI